MNKLWWKRNKLLRTDWRMHNTRFTFHYNNYNKHLCNKSSFFYDNSNFNLRLIVFQSSMIIIHLKYYINYHYSWKNIQHKKIFWMLWLTLCLRLILLFQPEILKKNNCYCAAPYLDYEELATLFFHILEFWFISIWHKRASALVK